MLLVLSLLLHAQTVAATHPHFVDWSADRKIMYMNVPRDVVRDVESLAPATKHTCVHDELAKLVNHTVDPQHYESATTTDDLGHKRQVGFDTFRVAFDFSSMESNPANCVNVGDIVNTPQGPARCEQQDILTPEKITYIKNTLAPSLTAWFADFIKVKRVVGDLNIRSGPCVTSSIAATTVKDADLVIFSFANPSGQPSVLAYAAACRFDQKGRSIAG